MAKRRLRRKTRIEKSSKLSLPGFLIFIAAAFLIGGVFLFLYYAKDLPRPERFTERQITLPTKIYDSSGKVLLYQIYGEEKRTLIQLAEIPQNLKQAVIAAEDANFYNHFGLDFKGIARAILQNLKLKAPIQGASTISQQLIRSTFLTREKTAERKIREIILTLELERRYSKEQILEWYLNQVPFGANSYGVEAASQTYFNKSVRDISLSEAALLASLIRAPSYLSPYGPNKKELLFRKNYVLEQMAKGGYITKDQAKEAKENQLVFAEILQPIKAPHFVLYVKDYLDLKYGETYLREGGAKVYTTLDWELQEAAEASVKKWSKENSAYNAHNAALVAINPNNGNILAMVGSADYFATSSRPAGCEEGKNCLFEPKVNAASYGIGRQPGSAFKPFAYAKAFIKGFTPETILWDVKTQFNPDCPYEATSTQKDPYGQNCYLPKNYDDKFRGPITMKAALSQSINIPSIKTLYLAGVKETIDLARSMGITTLDQPMSWYGLSLVLGGGEVKLLDLVSAYSVFANDGLRVAQSGILKIEDNRGNVIEENKKTPKRVLESQISRLITDILSDNEERAPIFGRNSPLFIQGYQIAAKTGTTQDFRDGWTIGYTTSITAGVWVGNNDNTAMKKEPGVVLAGPIWNQFMREALKKYPPKNFPKPPTFAEATAGKEKIEVKKDVLKGIWDKENPHSILHYVNKNDPLGSAPEDPGLDPQYLKWEEGIQNWLHPKPSQ